VIPEPETRRAVRHHARVRRALPPKSKRGASGCDWSSAQRAARERERQSRREAVALSQWLVLHRQRSPGDVAWKLWLKERTLRQWRRCWKKGRCEVKDRGRPRRESTPEQRRAVRSVLLLAGTRVSIHTLWFLFPKLARAELIRIKRRLRRALARKRTVTVGELRWTKAGTVWAMDFAEAPLPIDGQYRYVLLVRDLASGKQLLHLPCEHETSQVVRDALLFLFSVHAPPLVLKMDNGPGFIAGETQKLLDQHGVLPLMSPPYMPSYNGAIEAGVGSMKTRTHHEAARQGRPGEWTCDDVEASRLQANELSRPRGRNGRTPDQAWALRGPIEKATRSVLLLRMAECWLEEYGTLGLLPGVKPEQTTLDRIRRAATVRALIDTRLLVIGSRRITALKAAEKTDKNT